MNSKMLTALQVAEHLQVTEHTVYDWLRTGRLQGVKVGRLWRVSPSSLDAFLGNSERDEYDAPMTDEEIAESESAWRDYLSGQDRGESLAHLRSQLLGAPRG